MPASDSPPKPEPRRRGPGKAKAPVTPFPESLTLRETLSSVLQEQLLPVVAKFDEQLSGMQAKVASLEQRIPDTQGIVDKVAAVLGPELSKQITEKLQGLAASSAQPSANGHSSEGKAVVGAVDQKPSLAAKADDLLTMVGAIADVVLGKFYPLYLDHRKEARLDRQEARADKLMDTNPFMVADTMRASNSPLLPMYAAAFAPLPQVVVDARVREATDAVLIGMRARAEATKILREEPTRQREGTPSPGLPSSSGSPTDTLLPSSTNPSVPKSGGVNMNSKSRLTLREVMG